MHGNAGMCGNYIYDQFVDTGNTWGNTTPTLDDGNDMSNVKWKTEMETESETEIIRNNRLKTNLFE